MIGRTNAGGGGLSLTVKVHASAPAESRSGKENEIWVVSDTPITNWVVSSKRPGTPAAGTVWIQDGTVNGINIVKKNAVEVFPSNCEQYVDGDWQRVDAYLFESSNKWTKFSTHTLVLFTTGDQKTDITGGWSVAGYTGSYVNSGSFKVNNAGNLEIPYIASSVWGVGGTVKKIDLTLFNILHATIQGNTGYMEVRNEKRKHSDVKSVAEVKGSGNIALNISGLVGEYYISFETGNNATFTVSSVWME